MGGAFFRPQGRIVRDLGILAAAVHRQERGSLRVLEGMAGCGVRSLRYGVESGADFVWCNEGNPDLAPLLVENLRPLPSYRISHEPARRLLARCLSEQDYYDFIDLDGFGDPLGELPWALGAMELGGWLYLTSTDGRSLTGHLPPEQLPAFGGIARVHPAGHEQGLRILLGALQRQAATMGYGIRPGFAYYTGGTYRILAQLTRRRQFNPKTYGWLGYCHHCGDYQVIPWRRLGRCCCPGDGQPLTLTGPMWLGNLHDPVWLGEMAALATAWQWRDVVQLLACFAAEATLPPYFYPLGAIAQGITGDLPRRSHLIAQLQAAGYAAAATHINPEAIKTTARLAVCRGLLGG
ncbi:MAG: tRNA (guanine-N1)-methyltransferase [Spirulina sp. DLM2.Bin59]|nr:MAG: tRNA (guanine-N1)-methyltransferase [Spirulina sp. DLM2.Bin59]